MIPNFGETRLKVSVKQIHKLSAITWFLAVDEGGRTYVKQRMIAYVWYNKTLNLGLVHARITTLVPNVFDRHYKIVVLYHHNIYNFNCNYKKKQFIFIKMYKKSERSIWICGGDFARLNIAWET